MLTLSTATSFAGTLPGYVRPGQPYRGSGVVSC